MCLAVPGRSRRFHQHTRCGLDKKDKFRGSTNDPVGYGGTWVPSWGGGVMILWH